MTKFAPGGNAPGKAGAISRVGLPSLKTARDKEREWLGLAESDYRRFVSAWKGEATSTASGCRNRGVKLIRLRGRALNLDMD
jgi:hypothetical protein